MATYDLEEQEKLDEFKAWWKRWGTLLLFVAALAVAAAAGWRWMQHKEQTHALEAAAAFAKLEQALDSKNAKVARDLAAALTTQYAESAFAPRAALLVGHMEFEAGALPAAQKQLEWAATHATEPGVRDLARLRLAGVQLDAKQFDAALKTLSAAHSEAFAPRFADLRGDVLLAQGKSAEASKAYELALKGMDDDDPYRPLVELKRDSTR